MSTQINFTYDSLSSIDAAIKEMQAYQEQLTHKCRILVKRVAEIGVEIARVNIADFDAIYSGELLSSIRAEYSGSVPDGASWLCDHGLSVGGICGVWYRRRRAGIHASGYFHCGVEI